MSHGGYGRGGGGGGGGGGRKDQTRKIFIGGLNYNTTEDTLKSHFSQYGEIVDIVVMKFPDTKRSRGFGFVTYATDDQVDACQAGRPHTIDGKMVETKRATPREEFGKPEAGQTIKKLFLGGLKEEVTDEEIRTYFTQFGSIAEITRLTDKDTGKKKGFGFVEFDDYDPVDKCLLQGNHMLGGRRVDVKKAVSKQELNAQGGGGGRGGGMGGRGGGRGGQQGGWGGGGGGYQNGGGYQSGGGGGWGGQQQSQNSWSGGGGGYGGGGQQGWGDQGGQGGFGGGQQQSGGWGGAAQQSGGWGGNSGWDQGGAQQGGGWNQGGQGFGNSNGYSQGGGGGFGGGAMRSGGGGGYRSTPYGQKPDGGRGGGAPRGRGGFNRN